MKCALRRSRHAATRWSRCPVSPNATIRRRSASVRTRRRDGGPRRGESERRRLLGSGDRRRDPGGDAIGASGYRSLATGPAAAVNAVPAARYSPPDSSTLDRRHLRSVAPIAGPERRFRLLPTNSNSVPAAHQSERDHQGRRSGAHIGPAPGGVLASTPHGDRTAVTRRPRRSARNATVRSGAARSR